MNIIVFTQDVILTSMIHSLPISQEEKVIFLSTHKLFENERELLSRTYSKVEFITFADLMTDADGARIDHEANSDNINTLNEYINNVNYKKNIFIVEQVRESYGDFHGFVCCNGLGIDENVWEQNGFSKIRCDCYYTPEKKLKSILKKSRFLKWIYSFFIPGKIYRRVKENIFEGFFEGQRYVFIGKLNRIGYRMSIKWKQSNREARKLVDGEFDKAGKTIYLTTIHELPKAIMVGVDRANDIEFRIIQDGYLAPNDPCEYLYYYPSVSKFYAWDVLGAKIFTNYNLQVDLMPFRKKIYLPYITFKPNIKKVLVAMSGPGDWTAIKNRSDEDLLIEAIVVLAQKYPSIKFVIRCHPTWIRPECNGTNSIKRCSDYIESMHLPNVSVSSNIPVDKGENSFARSSLEEDLKDTDFVFGEHSISMIDGVMKNIPFSSVNLTNRRNLFVGITNLGFPHCESLEDMEKVLKSYTDGLFQKSFNDAISNYNAMTDDEIIKH